MDYFGVKEIRKQVRREWDQLAPAILLRLLPGEYCLSSTTGVHWKFKDYGDLLQTLQCFISFFDNLNFLLFSFSLSTRVNISFPLTRSHGPKSRTRDHSSKPIWISTAWPDFCYPRQKSIVQESKECPMSIVLSDSIGKIINHLKKQSYSYRRV